MAKVGVPLEAPRSTETPNALLALHSTKENLWRQTLNEYHLRFTAISDFLILGIV